MIIKTTSFSYKPAPFSSAYARSGEWVHSRKQNTAMTLKISPWPIAGQRGRIYQNREYRSCSRDVSKLIACTNYAERCLYSRRRLCADAKRAFKYGILFKTFIQNMMSQFIRNAVYPDPVWWRTYYTRGFLYVFIKIVYVLWSQKSRVEKEQVTTGYHHSTSLELAHLSQLLINRS